MPPPPGGSIGCLGASRRPSEHGRVPGRDERRLQLLDRPVRMERSQQGGGAGDVRRRHARPREQARTRRPAAPRERRRPERADVRLQREPERGRAAGARTRHDDVVGDAAATVIARSEVPGEPTEPRPSTSIVVAGRDDRDDAGGGRVVERVRDGVARRLDLRLAEGEVDHVHAVGDGRLDRGDELRRVAVRGRRPSRSGTVRAL